MKIFDAAAIDAALDPHAAIAYLNRSVVNGSRSKVRRRMTARAFALPVAGVEPSAENGGMDISRRHDLVAAVHQLPRRQREVVVARYYLGLTEAQTAQLLQVGLGSVKRHAHRALASLQRGIEVTS